MKHLNSFLCLAAILLGFSWASAETAIEIVQVGTVNGGQGTIAPISLMWCNSESETVYTAEQLNLEDGAKIKSLIYRGYSNPTKTVTFNVTIWIANADEATLVNSSNDSLFVTSGMTQVFDEEMTFLPKGSSSEPVDMIVVNLEEPFEYAGGALRVIARSLGDDWSSGIYFERDQNVSGQCIYRRHDNQETFLNGLSNCNTTDMPVVYLGIEKDAAIFSGVVIEIPGFPIEGVTVTLTSQEQPTAVYTATTDDEGKFNVKVIQKDKTYNAKFSKEGYKDVDITGLDFADGNITLNGAVIMELDNPTGVKSLNASKTVADVKYYNVTGQAFDKAFQGVNIVVTTYTDGTTGIVKVIK